MKESKEGVTRMRKWPVLDIQTLSLPFLCLHHQPWCKLAIIPFNVPSIHRPARLSSSPLPPPPPSLTWTMDTPRTAYTTAMTLVLVMRALVQA